MAGFLCLQVMVCWPLSAPKKASALIAKVCWIWVQRAQKIHRWNVWLHGRTGRRKDAAGEHAQQGFFMSFHQRLKHERLVKGWTIAQLSQASGVTENRISMLERDLVEMVSDSLKAQLAKALGVDFHAAPSQTSGAVPMPTEHPSAAKSEPVLPVVPAPLALHLGAALQQALELAARQHGRSLHGEVLARLEASLQGGETVTAAAPALAVCTPAQAVSPSQTQTAGMALQLSEADLDYITLQVAARLQAQR